VFRSNRNIVAQVIDDTTGTTLASALSNEPSLASELAGKSKSEKAKRVGQVVAERALAAGIKTYITTNLYTQKQDFTGAIAVFEDLSNLPAFYKTAGLGL